MNKGGPLGQGGQPFNRAITSSTEQKSFGRAPSAAAATNIVSSGGKLVAGTGIVSTRAPQKIAIGPPWLFAHVLLNARSYDLNEQFQLSVRSLDRASDTRIHFQDIGNPRVRGEVFEQIASPELLSAQELEADLYMQEIGRLGGEWHHRLTETEALASKFAIDFGDLPAIAFRTNPFTIATTFALRPSWYATREARWTFIDALEAWLTNDAKWLDSDKPLTVETLIRHLEQSLEALAERIEERVSNAPPPPLATLDPSSQAVFRKQGEGWLIKYGASETFVPHRKGMDYIAVLLKSPNRKIAAETLWHAVNATPIAKAPQEDLEAGSFSDRSSASRLPVERQRDINAPIDSPAEQAYRASLAKIDEQLADAKVEFDHAAVERLSKDRDDLLEQLSHEGEQGSVRSAVTPESKRVRNAVRKAIDESIDTIRRSDALLAEHLCLSIQTGAHLKYDPPHFISWDV